MYFIVIIVYNKQLSIATDLSAENHHFRTFAESNIFVLLPRIIKKTILCKMRGVYADSNLIKSNNVEGQNMKHFNVQRTLKGILKQKYERNIFTLFDKILR